MRHHFQTPPVNEVAIGEVFVPRTDLLIPQLGAFWDRHLRSEFPMVEHAAPILDVAYSGSLYEPSLPRLLMSGDDVTVLIQLQSDRLYVNWRKLDEAHEYPRFDAVRNRYLDIRSRLNEFLKELSGDELVSTGYEVTYTNALLARHGWSGFNDLPKFFKPWRWDAAALGLPTQSLRLSLELALPNDNGQLFLNINPATKKDTGETALRVDLSAQANASVANRMSLPDWSSIAHDVIVETFVRISPDDQLARWGHRQEAGQ